MSTESDSTSVNMDREGCSIPEVMVELHSIPGVSVDDDFHDFATEYLSLRRKREMWSSMGDMQQKLRWLQRMYERTQHSATGSRFTFQALPPWHRNTSIQLLCVDDLQAAEQHQRWTELQHEYLLADNNSPVPSREQQFFSSASPLSSSISG
ncbi:hypothetical protein Peur_013530 [Populus x canadensis]